LAIDKDVADARRGVRMVLRCWPDIGMKNITPITRIFPEIALAFGQIRVGDPRTCSRKAPSYNEIVFSSGVEEFPYLSSSFAGLLWEEFLRNLLSVKFAFENYAVISASFWADTKTRKTDVHGMGVAVDNCGLGEITKCVRVKSVKATDAGRILCYRTIN
jgi:hypothetical protein